VSALGLRDRIGIPFKPEEEVRKLGLKEGQKVLDYGCGIGSYTFPAARLVGDRGRVYASDREPLAKGTGEGLPQYRDNII